MRTLLLILALSGLPGIIHGRQDEKTEPGNPVLAVGKDLPAPITPYNASGMAKQRFHDPIGPHSLDPFVLVFTTDTDFSDGLKKLLKGVDNAIEKNPAIRLASCCVFIPATIKTSVVAEDDPREALSERLTGLAKELELKHVILAIDSPANLEAYKTVLTGTHALVLNKLRLVGVFGGNQLDAKAAADLELYLVEKLGAKQK